MRFFIHLADLLETGQSETQITPGAHLYTPVPHQWANSVLCGHGLLLQYLL
jgi:hypothetical protein